MRWTLGWIAIGTLVAGCGMDGLSARSDVAAEVGDYELSAERVAEILGKTGNGPTVQAAEFVSNIWLDYSIFAEAVATGQLKTDSATVARVMWPEIAQARVRIFHDSVMKARQGIAPGAADSAYGAGEVKVFQHIITMPTGPTAADSGAARQLIQRALARVKGGEDFGAVAREVSADGSKEDGGYLPVGPKGQFVPEFENAAWALAPGQLSEVVQSQFGWHIIRRPTLDEARTRFDDFLRERGAQAADSTFLAEIGSEYGLKVAGGAAAAMRAAAQNPDAARRSSKTLVALQGDDLTVGDFVRWIGMFPQNILIQIRNANDSMLTQYAEGLGQTTIMLRKADSARVQLEPAQWQFLTVKYSEAVASLRRDLGLEIPELSDSSSLTPGQRSKLAAEKVEDYFGRLLEGQAQMQVLLPPLGADLRASKIGRVNQAGVARAVELATAQFRRDSAAAAGRIPPGQGVVPAPGGPPVADTTGQ